MKKFFIALIGGTVLLVGIALLVLPGPGLPIIATEFFWAKRALRRAKDAFAKVRRKSGVKDWLKRFSSRRTGSQPAVKLGGEGRTN